MSSADLAPGRDSGAVRASVCMATYRGAEYVEQQIRSILDQLGRDDERVVVDDDSPDATFAVLSSFDEPRMRLFRNETNRGYVRTFERALQLADGRYLFLSDQDDVWIPGRLETMLEALREKAVVSTSVCVLGQSVDPPRFRLHSRDSERHLANIFAVMVGSALHGCAMAFRRDIAASVLPIPEFVFESHDLWPGARGQHSRAEHAPRRRPWHAACTTPTRRPWVGAACRRSCGPAG